MGYVRTEEPTMIPRCQPEQLEEQCLSSTDLGKADKEVKKR